MRVAQHHQTDGTTAPEAGSNKPDHAHSRDSAHGGHRRVEDDPDTDVHAVDPTLAAHTRSRQM